MFKHYIILSLFENIRYNLMKTNNVALCLVMDYILPLMYLIPLFLLFCIHTILFCKCFFVQLDLFYYTVTAMNNENNRVKWTRKSLYFCVSVAIVRVSMSVFATKCESSVRTIWIHWKGKKQNKNREQWQSIKHNLNESEMTENYTKLFRKLQPWQNAGKMRA